MLGLDQNGAYLISALGITIVVLGGYVRLASDGGDSWHDDSLLSCGEEN